MAIIKVRGYEIDVDLVEELNEFDWGYNARWSSDKLIASSPFRSDKTPSFFVNLEGEYAGYWGDSGAVYEEQASGNFAALIAYLRSTSLRDAEEYLLGEYGRQYDASEDIRIPAPRLKESRSKRVALSTDIITEATSPYLESRGITSEVQALFGIGYNERHKGFTAIPWRFANGHIGNIKYRSTTGKRFFFEKGATPIREMVYGIDTIEDEFAVICEGEIDAMSWRVAGIAAIALGGANITQKQADTIRSSPIRQLALGADNDATGDMLNRRIERMLRWDKQILAVDYGKEKDANDVLRQRGVEGLCELVAQTSPIRAIHLRV